MFPSSIPVPDQVLAIARRLEDAGHEAWCVGGAIRDTLLERPTAESRDFDLATSATPQEVRRLFRRTVPVGLEHGTVGVLDRDNVLHEVTTFRQDVTTDGRHATVAFGVSLEDDLARRDFTINAIAYHPLRQEWRDPFDGAGDLERTTVRAVGDPEARFREDYLRILRAIRFATRFEFVIAPATWAAACAAVSGLRRLSAERVRDEWFRGMITAAWVSAFLDRWNDVGAMALWLPELEWTGAGHATRNVADALPRDPVLITAALSCAPRQSLLRLRCSNAEVSRGTAVHALREHRPAGSEGADARRWLALVGDAALDLLTLARARGEAEWADAVEDVRVTNPALRVTALAVSGNDLIAAGVPRGPAVGTTLRRLLDAVIEDPSRNTREELLDMVQE